MSEQTQVIPEGTSPEMSKTRTEIELMARIVRAIEAEVGSLDDTSVRRAMDLLSHKMNVLY